MDLIDGLFASISSYLSSVLPEGALSSLIAEGLIPGIGGIMMFIPQIAILFAFISILEESGYMSRVVFLMDKIMRKFGLKRKKRCSSYVWCGLCNSCHHGYPNDR